MGRGLHAGTHTAATTVMVWSPSASVVCGGRQLCGPWKMMASSTGYPPPLLLYVSVPPPTRLTSTLNAEMEVVADRVAAKE